MGRREDRIVPRTNVGVLSAAFGGALLALAGHLELLKRFGTVLPYRDQWRLTAVDLLGPYFDGRLGLKDFFAPLNDHWPVLTRLLSFGLLQLNGQWNNLVETSCNALLFSAAIALFLFRILPSVPGVTRPLFGVLAGLILALPITWENTLWGIQSLVYLQIALTIIYLTAVAGARTFSWLWWGGHLAGVAVLLTQHSGVLAHVAAAILLGWRWWRGDGDRRVNAVGFSFAATAIVAFAVFFPSITTTAALRADSWQLALDVTLRQLAWPMPHPAWALLLYLPWVAWALNRVCSRRLDRSDAFVVVCGLWVGGQAAAIGYGRAVDTHTFASRYCDFLALGFLLNAVCIARFWTYFESRALRAIIVVFAAVWVIAPVKSFWWESTESHAGYNLERRPGENFRNLHRLQRYFARHDPAVLLNDPGTERELYTYAPDLPPLLERREFQSLLPPETGSPLARQDHGRLGWLPAVLLPASGWIFSAGLLLLGVSLTRVIRYRRLPETTYPDRSHFTWRAAAFCTAGCVVASGLAWRAWRQPDIFTPTQRLNAAYAPLEPGVTLADLEFQQHDGNMHAIVPARGAVDTLPQAARTFWYGTRLRTKPDFRGVLKSQPIRVQARYLIIPFTGYPCFPGNGLRVLFTDPVTKEETWVSYVGNDAAADWNTWTIDASAHKGATATLFLYDGNTGTPGWLGVARPAQTDDAQFGVRWRAILRAERAESTHRTLTWFTLVGSIAVLLAAGASWRKRYSRIAPPPRPE